MLGEFRDRSFLPMSRERKQPLPSSVPQIRFTPQGPIIPTNGDILAGVQIDINYAFGGGVNPALTTPQGQLASSTAAIISDKDSEIAYIVNQIGRAHV